MNRTAISPRTTISALNVMGGKFNGSRNRTSWD
jgi:hypothetical protein